MSIEWVHGKVMRFHMLLAGIVLAGLAAACSAPPLALTIEATDMAYSTLDLRAVVGKPVRLTFVNAGALEHDFSIGTIKVGEFKYVEGGMETHQQHGQVPAAGAPQLHVMALPGAQAIAEFTPLQAGLYEFFCTTEGHKEAGMHGSLLVQ